MEVPREKESEKMFSKSRTKQLSFSARKRKKIDELMNGSLVGFYGISILVGYLMPNHVYEYIYQIYDLWTFLNETKKYAGSEDLLKFWGGSFWFISMLLTGLK